MAPLHEYAAPRTVRVRGEILPPTDDVLERMARSDGSYRVVVQLRAADGSKLFQAPASLCLFRDEGPEGEALPTLELVLNVAAKPGEPATTQQERDADELHRQFIEALAEQPTMASMARHPRPAKARALVEGPGHTPVGVAAQEARSRASAPQRDAEILALARTGITQAEIGRTVGVAQGTVSRVMRAAGVRRGGRALLRSAPSGPRFGMTSGIRTYVQLSVRTSDGLLVLDRDVQVRQEQMDEFHGRLTAAFRPTASGAPGELRLRVAVREGRRGDFTGAAAEGFIDCLALPGIAAAIGGA